MSYNCDVNSLTIKDLKIHLTEIGLYEDGMEIQEMRDIFQTLKHSEQSANEEKEYRETLTIANKHCEEVMELISESNVKKENNYNLRSKEKDSLEITTIDDNSNDTNFSPPLDIKDSDDTPTKEIVKDPTKEIKETPKSPKKTKNIDVFSYCDIKRDSLTMLNNNNIVLQPIYCQPEIRNLPPDLAVKAIQEYHDIIANHYKLVQNKSVNLVPWGKAINLPKLNLNKDNQKDDLKEDSQKDDSFDNNTSDEKKKGYKCVRSRRQIKRKHYTEINSDEDENEVISIKKCKEASFKTIENDKRKTFNSECDEMDKIFDDLKNSDDLNTVKKLNKTRKDGHCSSDEEPSVLIKVSAEVHNDGTNNIQKNHLSTPVRNKPKRNMNNRNINNNDTDVIECIDDNPASTNSTNKRKIVDQLDIEDDCDQVTSNEDSVFVRRRITPPNPFKEKLSQRSEQKIKNLNCRTKKRPNSVCKPENQKNKLFNKENEETEESKEITTKKFYGNNKENINKTKLLTLATKEEEYECPMCYKSFPVSVIQQHASGCNKSNDKTENGNEKNVKPSGLCYKCDAFILHDLEKHLEECDEVTK